MGLVSLIHSSTSFNLSAQSLHKKSANTLPKNIFVTGFAPHLAQTTSGYISVMCLTPLSISRLLLRTADNGRDPCSSSLAYQYFSDRKPNNPCLFNPPFLYCFQYVLEYVSTLGCFHLLREASKASTHMLVTSKWYKISCDLSLPITFFIPLLLSVPGYRCFHREQRFHYLTRLVSIPWLCF